MQVNIIYYLILNVFSNSEQSPSIFSYNSSLAGEMAVSAVQFCLEFLNCNKMRSAGVYLIQAEIGAVRNAVIPAGDIVITLRVGRSSASVTLNNPQHANELYLGSLIQLNVDSSALETQRCSISFYGVDKRIIGIALISLPKDKSVLQKTFRFTQNEDKRAEVDVKVKIVPFEVGRTAEVRQVKQTKESVPSAEKILTKISSINSIKLETNSSNPENVSMKSKMSEQPSHSSQDRKAPKSFKLREEDKVVQTTQSQLKLLRDQKEAYYQLYQIEKAKSETAAKFIANLVKRIGEKHPSLITVVSDGDKNGEGEKKGKSQVDNAMVEQLEQANRSLHRQVEEYKRLVEQLKKDIIQPARGDIPLNSKVSNTFLLPGIFDGPSKSNLQAKSNIKNNSAVPSSILSNIPERPEKASLTEIDFKKWLDLSVGQREYIQTQLASICKPAQSNERGEKALKKLKAALDKSFTALLLRKDLGKDALLNHKKQVNRFFEQALAA